MNPRNEPAALAAFVKAVLAFVLIMGWWKMTTDATNALHLIIDLGLALFIRQSVVPVVLAKKRMKAGAVDPTVPLDKQPVPVKEAPLPSLPKPAAWKEADGE